jgi:hypothetical protein
LWILYGSDSAGDLPLANVAECSPAPHVSNSAFLANVAESSPTPHVSNFVFRAMSQNVLIWRMFLSRSAYINLPSWPCRSMFRYAADVLDSPILISHSSFAPHLALNHGLLSGQYFARLKK